MADSLMTDFKLVFEDTGAGGLRADLSFATGDIEAVSQLDNLAQALALRLLVHRGELTALGHARYGSQIRELIGEVMDRANLELLRRYVRKALLEDPRVKEVTRVIARPRADTPGAVDVSAGVLATSGQEITVEVTFDAG